MTKYARWRNKEYKQIKKDVSGIFLQKNIWVQYKSKEVQASI
jgi:hypothetical protein